ncbi:sulfite exporter TauE/SafE family protein [Achromobacter sp. ACM02]|uniref:sulfite exporter TauE/SafE family protein n=1 Tax=Achromobacter sp. ACM02 TaxID=2769305 RepID=UPI0017803408|nr:sulfite exporter TauE/SafE family protein [Achromobacter sp. ACM02]MBD9380483.1 sulfite exporter TauE/SafE family protein [Achromobacter sp. ACM02]
MNAIDTLFLYDPKFYLVAIPAVLLRGVSKAGFGSGLGGFSLPLLITVLPPTQAAAILLPILCLIDIAGFGAYYKKWDSQSLRVILPGALLGTAAGWLVFDTLSDGLIIFLVGIIALVFSTKGLLKSSTSAAALPGSRARGTFWSALSGFTSFLSHSGGPPIQVYLIPLKLEKEKFIATINIFFMLTNMFKIVPYALLGQFSKINMIASALMLPLVPIGVWCGLWLQRRIDAKSFYAIVQICLLLTGLLMMYEGGRKLWA